MSHNSFGRVLRFSTWGESHGPAIGAIVDGCPPGLALSEDDIQPWLDRRRPGTSRFTTQRREPDLVRILSGTFEGRTTGTPISLMIDNVDQRSKDYAEIAGAYRPGHADWTYQAKYGHRDWRGSGRASARETASRVAAGGVARLVIPEVRIRACVVEIGGDAIDRAAYDDAAIDANPFFCPDAGAAARWEALVDAARKDGSSLGAIVECVATGVPPGLGGAALRQARRRAGGGDDVDQRGQGRRDRRRLRRGPAARRGECRRDARRADVPLQPCRRNPRRHIERPAGGGPGRVQADLLDRDAPADRRPGRRRDRHRHQGPPRSLRRHPRRAGGRGDDGPGPRRPEIAPSRPVRRMRP